MGKQKSTVPQHILNPDCVEKFATITTQLANVTETQEWILGVIRGADGQAGMTQVIIAHTELLKIVQERHKQEDNRKESDRNRILGFGVSIALLFIAQIISIIMVWANLAAR